MELPAQINPVSMFKAIVSRMVSKFIREAVNKEYSRITKGISIKMFSKMSNKIVNKMSIDHQTQPLLQILSRIKIKAQILSSATPIP